MVISGELEVGGQNHNGFKSMRISILNAPTEV